MSSRVSECRRDVILSGEGNRQPSVILRRGRRQRDGRHRAGTRTASTAGCRQRAHKHSWAREQFAVIVECGPTARAPHPTAAPNGGDTVLGQGTTFGECQMMTLMITAGQSMTMPRLRRILVAEPVSSPRDTTPRVRLLRRPAERGRRRRREPGHDRALANAVMGIGNSGAVEFGAWVAGWDVGVHVIDRGPTASRGSRTRTGSPRAAANCS